MVVGLFLLLGEAHAAPTCDGKKECGSLPIVWCEILKQGESTRPCQIFESQTEGEVGEDHARYRFACEVPSLVVTRQYYCKLPEPPPKPRPAPRPASQQGTVEGLRAAAPTDYSTLPSTPTPEAPAEPLCETESACSSLETYQKCEKAPCDFQSDLSLIARKVCDKGDFTAWCVKPKEQPHSTSGACICDHGSPTGIGFGALLLALFARKRR